MLEGTTALPQPAFSTATDGTTVTPQSDPVFVGGSVGANPMIFSPLRLSFKTKVSNQLFARASRIFEPVLRNVISRGISSILDNLALYGTGTNGQPLGVYSTVTPVNLTTTPLNLVWNFTKRLHELPGTCSRN
jgi:HK97 family phage major capsid protein